MHAIRSCPDPSRHKSHLRELSSINFHVQLASEEFLELARNVLLPRLRLPKGYKQLQREETAIQCLHSLVIAGLRRSAVADSRSTSNSDARKRRAVWDAIVEAGFAS